MPLNFLKEFNWVDIFVVITLFRISYVSLKSGFPASLFKLLGTLTAIYLSLHYYAPLADHLESSFFADKMDIRFLDFLLMIVLAIIGYLIFVLLRSVFVHLIKMEAVSNLNKWGGLILGVGRGILFSSLLLFILVVSPVKYLGASVDRSFLGPGMVKVAPDTYSFIWNAIASKFMPKEKFNAAVREAENEITKK